MVADTQPPKISILIGLQRSSIPVDQGTRIVRVQATDNVAVSEITLTVDGQPVALRPDGTADVYFSGAATDA